MTSPALEVAPRNREEAATDLAVKTLTTVLQRSAEPWLRNLAEGTLHRISELRRSAE